MIAASANLLAQPSNVVLSGLLQHGTWPGQNGQTAGSPIWNTLGNELSFANIYLTQPNAGYAAPLLNSGNGADASVAMTLTPGTYEFYFFAMGFWDNNPGEYGLNLFFEGNTVVPGIAGFSLTSISATTPVEGGRPTLSLNGDVTTAPGSLTYQANGLNVTLRDYGFGEPGVFGGPALDRVGNLNSLPDSYVDSVGRFTLVVAPVAVPEPSVLALLGVAVFLICVARRRTDATNKDPFSPAPPIGKTPAPPFWAGGHEVKGRL